MLTNLQIGQKVKYVRPPLKANDSVAIIDASIVEVRSLDLIKGTASVLLDYTTKEQREQEKGNEHRAIADYSEPVKDQAPVENTFHLAESETPAATSAAAAAPAQQRRNSTAVSA